jgi:ribosomal protein L11 methyltransferase
MAKPGLIMPYLKLTLPINETQFEAFEAVLSSSGAVSVTMEDAGDAPILEPGVDETPLWHELTLSALFNPNFNQKKLRNKLKKLLDPVLVDTLTFEAIADEAWELKWLEHFTPICFDNVLWIGTEQHQPDQEYQALIYLEPGLAFGTGTHPSTYMCLEWLAQHDLRNQTVIDYGCGSGILAIAAAKLGAKTVWCVDNDPQALTATLGNAQKNNIRLNTYLPEALPKVEADIVLANILANPLTTLAPLFLKSLKPKGHLVLAGILASQEQFVKDAYAPDISWQDTRYKEEWVRLSGVKA